MVTVKINDKARGSKRLIKHLHTLKFVEFEENENNFNDADVEFEALEKHCITGDELVSRVCILSKYIFPARGRIHRQRHTPIRELIMQAPTWTDEEYNNYLEARQPFASLNKQ
jgi:hypothetical protein